MNTNISKHKYCVASNIRKDYLKCYMDFFIDYSFKGNRKLFSQFYIVHVDIIRHFRKILKLFWLLTLQCATEKNNN